MSGGSSQPLPDPNAQAQADIVRMQEQSRIDQANRDEARQYAAQQETAARGRYGEELTANRGNALNSVEAMFGERGVDSSQYQNQINSRLDREQGGMSFTNGNNTFGPDLGDTILGDIRNENIRGYQSGINDWAPVGFEKNTFADTADDSIIDQIMADQYNEASGGILRARDRGTLNDTGFRYAMDNLEQQRTAGNSRLQDTGGGILSGYRGQVGDIASNARTSAGGWDFGDTFDGDTFYNDFQSTTGDLNNRLEGDIRGALGGEQLFDIGSLIQKGGVGQGAQNTGVGGFGSQSGSLLTAMGDRKNDEEKSRGLGTVGAF